MEYVLTQDEVRVLASLMEKEASTPEYYPLSLRSLTAACNQRSNRDPVVDYDEDTVQRLVEGLMMKQLVWESGASGRVVRYEHGVARDEDLSTAEAAILCELMLRGPQTTGALKANCKRMYDFGSVEEVEEALQSLTAHGLCLRLPLQHGRKEPRTCHLLAGVPEADAPLVLPQRNLELIDIKAQVARIDNLETEVAALKASLEELKNLLK
jgi:uncharacterized protein YceH (UPF0502 family)